MGVQHTWRGTDRKDSVAARFFDRSTDLGTGYPLDAGADVSGDGAAPAVLAPRAKRRDRQWRVLAAVSLGGSLGSVIRYLISQALPVHPGHFPWATFTINVSGCLTIGLLMVLVLDVWPPNRYVRPFLGIGVLGGYTTFSTFAVELRALGAHGSWGIAAAYAAGSLVGGSAAVWCGMILARLIAGLPVRRHREGRRA
jgi:fluoride exporter